MKRGKLIDARLQRKIAINRAEASYDTPSSGRMDLKLPQRCIRSVAATKGTEWLKLHPSEKHCYVDDGAVTIKRVSNFSAPRGIVSQHEAFPTRQLVSLRTTGDCESHAPLPLAMEERLLAKYPEVRGCKDALRTAQHPLTPVAHRNANNPRLRSLPPHRRFNPKHHHSPLSTTTMSYLLFT